MNITWFKHAIIYHILIDRFAGYPSTKNWETPTFLGGILNGITEKISYLNDLGINTIWISPFYQTSAYHGYHITDFYQVDPHYGTLEDLKTLIQTIHQNNMRIIADFVPNHCSKEHPYFKDAQHDRNSPYQDWFYFTHWPDEYQCFLSIREIPKINLDNQEARHHIITAAEYWLNLGLDGYRLDHVIGPSHDFWKEFTTTIRTKHPTSILIGEAWMHGIKRHELQTLHITHKYLKWLHGAVSDTLFKEYIGELDGVLDFRVQQLIKNLIIDRKISIKTFYKLLKNHYNQFPKTFFLPTFLDNHDMDRFLFLCGNDIEKLQQAARLQFSLPQPVIIYYGTESGVTQTQSIWKNPSYGDLQARQPMNWDQQNTALIQFYKQAIAQKKDEKN
ncbi:MAG: alpha-amylase family glycosyl hydrolase [Methanobacteriota archaeon]